MPYIVFVFIGIAWVALLVPIKRISSVVSVQFGDGFKLDSTITIGVHLEVFLPLFVIFSSFVLVIRLG